MSSSFGPPSVRGGASLMRYEFRGATLDAPPDWGEDSALALVPSKDATIVLRRVSIAKDVTLDQFVSQRIAEMSPTVLELHVDEMREAVLGFQPAYRLKLTWTEAEIGRVAQYLVIGRFGEVCFTLSMSGIVGEIEKLQPSFDGLASTFRFPLYVAPPSAR